MAENNRVARAIYLSHAKKNLYAAINDLKSAAMFALSPIDKVNILLPVAEMEEHIKFIEEEFKPPVDNNTEAKV